MEGRSQDGRREEGGRGVQTSPQGRLPGSRELSPSPGTWAPSLVRERARGSGSLGISPQLGGTANRATHQAFYSGSDCCRNNRKITQAVGRGDSGGGFCVSVLYCFIQITCRGIIFEKCLRGYHICGTLDQLVFTLFLYLRK